MPHATIAQDRKYMGTKEDARLALVEKTTAWRALRQPIMGSARIVKDIERREHEARFQLANAALLWLWHEENPSRG